MTQSSSSIKEFYHNHAKDLKVSGRILKIISLIPKWVQGMSVLDVGCGTRLITSCMGVYANVKGIDIDEDITIYKEDKKYMVVTCFDVLEHVEDLHKAIDNIKALCHDGGLIIINQPEQEDKTQPIDRVVPLDILLHIGKLVYLENYRFSINESYNFMVFKK